MSVLPPKCCIFIIIAQSEWFEESDSYWLKSLTRMCNFQKSTLLQTLKFYMFLSYKQDYSELCLSAGPILVKDTSAITFCYMPLSLFLLFNSFVIIVIFKELFKLISVSPRVSTWTPNHYICWTRWMSCSDRYMTCRVQQTLHLSDYVWASS